MISLYKAEPMRRNKNPSILGKKPTGSKLDAISMLSGVEKKVKSEMGRKVLPENEK